MHQGGGSGERFPSLDCGARGAFRGCPGAEEHGSDARSCAYCRLMIWSRYTSPLAVGVPLKFVINSGGATVFQFHAR